MTTTEARQDGAAGPTEEQLRAWDWQAALQRDGRSRAWLARRAELSEGHLSHVVTGRRPTTIKTLRALWRVLGEGS